MLPASMWRLRNSTWRGTHNVPCHGTRTVLVDFPTSSRAARPATRGIHGILPFGHYLKPDCHVGAAARKLVHIIFGMLKSGRPFDPTMHAVCARSNKSVSDLIHANSQARLAGRDVQFKMKWRGQAKTERASSDARFVLRFMQHAKPDPTPRATPRDSPTPDSATACEW